MLSFPKTSQLKIPIASCQRLGIGSRYPHSNLVLVCPKISPSVRIEMPVLTSQRYANFLTAPQLQDQYQQDPLKGAELQDNTVGTAMEELKLELSALSAIFSANEFEVIWGDDCLAVSFPLRFRLEIQFVLTMGEEDDYDILVQILESETPPLEPVQKAAAAALAAAEEFLAGRLPGEHRHLYSAHQKALDAFDDRISLETSPSLLDKGLESGTSSEEFAQSACGGPLPETTVVILDHINDTKKYYKLLAKWSQQLDLCCVVLAKSPTKAKGDRAKHIVLIIQSVAKNTEFLRRLRTENVDVNLAGKPCKERCASTILVSRKYDYLEMNSRFQIFDCSTAAAVALLSDKYKVPDIGILVRNFCMGVK